jgi:hypothetical protein
VSSADFGDVLGSPAWTAVATVLAAAGIAVTIVLYRRGRPRKALSYSLRATQVVTTHTSVQDQIEVVFEGRPIRDVQLLRLRVANTGNVPVTEADFEEPLRLDFGEGASALTMTEPTADPPLLRPDYRLTPDALQVPPLLINPGDEFGLSILVSDYRERAELRYRIVGVPTMMETDDADTRPLWQGRWFVSGLTAAATAALLVSLIGGAVSLLSGPTKDNTLLTLKNAKTYCVTVRQTRKGTAFEDIDTGRILFPRPTSVAGIDEKAC